jgi:hypothetical protein
MLQLVFLALNRMAWNVKYNHPSQMQELAFAGPCFLPRAEAGFPFTKRLLACAIQMAGDVFDEQRQATTHGNHNQAFCRSKTCCQSIALFVSPFAHLILLVPTERTIKSLTISKKGVLLGQFENKGAACSRL